MLASYYSYLSNPESICVFLPSDHFIKDTKEFKNVVSKAIDFCSTNNKLVTLALKPSYPATGYGYIQTKQSKLNTVTEVISFKEKPDQKTAQQYLDQGDYFWNAGMFISSAKHIITEMKSINPSFSEPFSSMKSKNELLENAEKIYETIPRDSFDYAFLEKSNNIATVPCELGWSDVGSWDEAKHLFLKNYPQKEEDISKKNFFISPFFPRKKCHFIDIEDVTVVDSLDATLIYKNGSSQKVKNLVNELKSKKSTQLYQTNFEERPWGYFRVLLDTDVFKSKLISVLCGQQLSYQSHKKRDEHWFIVNGEAEVILDDKILTLKKGDNVDIPAGTKHRIANKNPSVSLEFIEVQTGSYFGEDDIIRYDDIYGRHKDKQLTT